MSTSRTPLLQSEEEPRTRCVGRNVGGTIGLIAVSAVLFGPGVALSIYLKNAVPFFGVTALQAFCFSPAIGPAYNGLFSCLGGRRRRPQQNQVTSIVAPEVVVVSHSPS